MQMMSFLFKAVLKKIEKKCEFSSILTLFRDSVYQWLYQQQLVLPTTGVYTLMTQLMKSLIRVVHHWVFIYCASIKVCLGVLNDLLKHTCVTECSNKNPRLQIQQFPALQAEWLLSTASTCLQSSLYREQQAFTRFCPHSPPPKLPIIKLPLFEDCSSFALFVIFMKPMLQSGVQDTCKYNHI